jgi:cellulose biosynthesis protein BcsQ
MEKISVFLAGPGHDVVTYKMLPAFMDDRRLSVVGQATNWDVLSSQLATFQPEVLVVHGGMSAGMDSLRQLISGMQAWNGTSIVLLPEAESSSLGSFQNMPGVVAGAFVLPVNWPELPALAYSAGETAKARVTKVSAAPVLMAEGAPAGNGYMPPGLQPVLTGTKRIAVLSHAGGAGVSTIAEALAYELAVRLSVRTLLLSLGLPAAATAHLRLRYTPNMVEFFERPGAASIKAAIQRMEGLEVLVSPENSLEYLRAGTTVDPQAPNSIYAGLLAADDGSYASMVMDLPSAESPWMLHPLAFANIALIVARPTVADLFAVRHTLNALSTLGSKLPRGSIYLVLNQRKDTSAFTPRQFQEELVSANDWAPLMAAAIEYDPNVQAAQDQRVPVVTRSEKMARGARQIISNLFPGMDRTLEQTENDNGGKSLFRLPKFRLG